MSVMEWLKRRSRRQILESSAFDLDARVQLECIRREISHALRDCTEPRRGMALRAIEHARGALDLWLLRPEIFLMLESDLGPEVAEQRIQALTPLFRGWVPAGTTCIPVKDAIRDPALTFDRGTREIVDERVTT